MEQEHVQRIQDLIKDCPRDRKVSKLGFEIPCKAKYIGLESHFECLEKDFTCRFSLSFGYDYFCICPVRVTIAKELKM
ncbi:MAG: hypothetical protein ACXADB_11810 [Candidatus Hermodarchaeia archaeon]|jgi:hypothetical protein